VRLSGTNGLKRKRQLSRRQTVDRETLIGYGREVALCRVCKGAGWKAPCSFCEGSGVDDTVNLDALARIIEAEVAKALGEPWARDCFGVHTYRVDGVIVGRVVECGDNNELQADTLEDTTDEFTDIDEARAWVESMVGGGEG
jgi:hypothetical protein